jgi:broad specificity phosphatase PhoE
MRRYLKFASLLLVSNLLFGFGVLESYDFLKNKREIFIDPVNYNEKKLDEKWAKEVIKGGYLLWFRHAERDKWTGTVTVYDWEQISKSIDASKTEWANAVCLNTKGSQEARLIGRVFSELKVNYSEVISSPSCRAMQMSRLAWRQPDQIWLSLLHPTAITLDQSELFAKDLGMRISNLQLQPSKNIIISGHGNTLTVYSDTLFLKKINSLDQLNMDEGGFAVLGIKNGKLILHHVFKNFYNFGNTVLEYPDPSSWVYKNNTERK